MDMADLGSSGTENWQWVDAKGQSLSRDFYTFRPRSTTTTRFLLRSERHTKTQSPLSLPRPSLALSLTFFLRSFLFLRCLDHPPDPHPPRQVPHRRRPRNRKRPLVVVDQLRLHGRASDLLSIPSSTLPSKLTFRSVRWMDRSPTSSSIRWLDFLSRTCESQKKRREGGSARRRLDSNLDCELASPSSISSSL